MKVVAGWLRHQGLERIDDALERREPRTVAEVPVGVGEQLLQPFVPLVERLEEGHRVGDVDRDRHGEVRRRLPHLSRAGDRRASARRRGRLGSAGPAASTPSARAPPPGHSVRAAAASMLPNPASEVTLQSSWQNVRNRPGNARSYLSRFAWSSSPHIPSRFTIDATFDASITSRSLLDVRARTKTRRSSAIGPDGCARPRPGTGLEARGGREGEAPTAGGRRGAGDRGADRRPCRCHATTSNPPDRQAGRLVRGSARLTPGDGRRYGRACCRTTFRWPEYRGSHAKIGTRVHERSHRPDRYTGSALRSRSGGTQRRVHGRRGAGGRRRTATAREDAQVAGVRPDAGRGGRSRAHGREAR